MALSSNTAWEVRPSTGSDTNGGGFVAGSTGTDWSQQASPQYSVTDGVTNASTTITSASANFGTDVVGNIIYVAGGTGSITAGWYQIVSRTNATTIVVDRSTGLTTGTGVTLNIGGAMKTIPTAIAVMVRSNKVFVKAESTIVTTATITLNTTGGQPSSSNPPNRLIGYTSSRTDGGKVTIQLSTNTGLVGLNATTTGWFIENFSVDCNNLGTSDGIDVSGYSTIKNCKVQNFKQQGISNTGFNLLLLDTEVTNGASGALRAVNLSNETSSLVVDCWIHDNACSGIKDAAGAVIVRCLITNNTGASSDGISLANTGSATYVINNVIYGSGRHGINFGGSTTVAAPFIRNNLLVSNGGFGLVLASAAGYPAFAAWDGNAYFNNTSGTRSNADDTSTNQINGVSPYTNTLDVILTADPFTNSAGGDFTLNNNPGGGAAARAAGSPGAIPGVTQTGKLDMGVFQHADPSINRQLIVQNIGTY